MAGGAETPKIAALPAIARLGACKSARGPDADRRIKLLIQFAVEGVTLGRLFTLKDGRWLLGLESLLELGLRDAARPAGVNRVEQVRHLLLRRSTRACARDRMESRRGSNSRNVHDLPWSIWLLANPRSIDHEGVRQI
jgi:hypothetical protein